MVIGVTGKYCAGKNLVAELLSQYGFRVIDEDRVGHEALSALSAEIADAFGPEIMDGDGSVNRRRLGSIVFADEKALSRLESIVHPWMVEQTKERIRSTHPPRVVVNAAILFKMKLHPYCDFVLLVRTPLPVRLVRAIRRDSLSLIQVVRRERSQRALNRVPEHVDTITVWNIGSRAALAGRVLRILKRRGTMDR